MSKFVAELDITISKLRALDDDGLIEYINKKIQYEGLEIGKLNNLPERYWSDAEKKLFTKLKKTQIKNLPNEYQLMLGFRNGELNKTGLSPQEIHSLRDKIRGIEINAPMSKNKFKTIILPRIFTATVLLLLFFIVYLFFSAPSCYSYTTQDFDSNWNVIEGTRRYCE